MRAWQFGIPTMRKGEVAKFKVAPEFAYGSDGTEKVPANSTVTYEIELVKWMPRVDLLLCSCHRLTLICDSTVTVQF